MRRWVAVAMLAGGSWACTSMPPSIDLSAGPALERALADQQRGRNKQGLLYQLTLIYAHPSSPSFDLRRAARTADRLIAEYPNGRYRAAAEGVRLLSRHIVALERQETEHASRLAGLERAVRRCRDRQVAEVPTPTPPSNAANEQRLLSEERAACHDAKRRLREAVASRDDQITRLSSALEALKRIDTEGGDPGG